MPNSAFPPHTHHSRLMIRLYQLAGYSVRSAYRLLKEEQTASAMAKTGETRTSADEHVWKAAWKVNVPPKVRVFWWRVLHNSLPSKTELKRSHVTLESFCEVCGDPDESLYHVIFRCPVARSFWAEVKKVAGVSIPDLHPGTWTTDALNPSTCSSAMAAMLICGTWALWTGRKVWQPGAAARYISSMLEELASLKTPSKSMQPRRTVQWKGPDEGWMKVNTDAAYDLNMCTGSAGVVIRNHSGLVQAAAARWLDDVPDALTAEAMAAKEGLELAVEKGYDRVILEVDCRGLKTLLDDRSCLRSLIGGICSDIIELGRSFIEFRVEWVGREACSLLC